MQSNYLKASVKTVVLAMASLLLWAAIVLHSPLAYQRSGRR